MRLDLVEAVTKLVNAKFIQHAFTFDHTYDSAVGDQGDWRANGVIENISSVFADDGLCVSLCMIYYSGVRLLPLSIPCHPSTWKLMKSLDFRHFIKWNQTAKPSVTKCVPTRSKPLLLSVV